MQPDHWPLPQVSAFDEEDAEVTDAWGGCLKNRGFGE